MKKLLAYLKWLLNDGRYIFIERQACGCCGSAYPSKLMIPCYMYNDFWDKWGICPKCKKIDDPLDYYDLEDAEPILTSWLEKENNGE